MLPSTTANQSLAINGVRLTARDIRSEEVVGSTSTTVDPNRSNWNVSLDLSTNGVQELHIRVDIELLHIETGADDVAFSGRTDVLSVRPGEERSAGTTPVFPGSLSNLSVTSVAIDGPVPSLTEGDTQQLTATVQGVSGAADVFWFSSNEQIATVSAGGVVSANLPGDVRIGAQVGPQTDEVTLTIIQRAAQVDVEPDEVVLQSVGETATYSAKVFDPRGAVITGGAVVWSVRDSDIAEATGGGSFRARAKGSTWVIAHAEGDPMVLDSAKLVVLQEWATVVVQPESILLESLGETATFTARVVDAQGVDVQGQTVTWSVKNPSVAQSLGDGVFRAISNGRTEVVATAVAAASPQTSAAQTTSSVQATAELVVAQKVTAVNLSPQGLEFSSLDVIQSLDAVFLDALGNPVVGIAPSWSSADPGIAGVDLWGNVLSVSNGLTAVSVQGAGFEASTSVVVAQVVATVGVLPGNAAIAGIGGTATLSATAYDANQRVIPGAAFSWASADPTVATVDGYGVVTGVGAGTTTIQASSGGRTGIASVRVGGPSTQRVYVSNSDGDDMTFIDLVAGTSTTFDCYSIGGSCNEPRNLAASHLGDLVAVPFRHSHEILIFDPTVPDFVDIITDASFDEPYAVSWTSDDSEIWVANKKGGGSWDGRISVISKATRSVVAVLDFPELASPEGIYVSGPYAYVANRGGPSLTIVNVATRTVVRDVVVGGNPRDVVATPDGQWAYVTSDGNYVTKVNVSTGVTTQITTPSWGTRNLAIMPDGTKVFVALQDNSIAIVDVATNAVSQVTFTGASWIYGVTVLSDGSVGYASDASWSGMVYQFDPVAGTEIIDAFFPTAVGPGARGITGH